MCEEEDSVFCDIANEHQFLKKLHTINSCLNIAETELNRINRRDICELSVYEAKVKTLEMYRDQKEEVALLMEKICKKE